MKNEKIKLLQDLQSGVISIDDLPLHLASAGLTEIAITLWHEIEPGVYQHKDTGRILQGDKPSELINVGEVVIKIKLFHDDGTKVPLLVGSEKHIDLG